MQTQKEMIRQHLEEWGKITAWEAITKYHITRAAHYIYQLKKEGMKIETVIKKGKKNRPYAEYIYRKDDAE